LPHGETLFVVASSDLEDVSFELIPQWISNNFLSHSAVKKYVALVVVVNFEGLLPTCKRVRNVELKEIIINVRPPLYLHIF
jgi:hypothetical protein